MGVLFWELRRTETRKPLFLYRVSTATAHKVAQFAHYSVNSFAWLMPRPLSFPASIALLSFALSVMTPGTAGRCQQKLSLHTRPWAKDNGRRLAPDSRIDGQ